MEVLVIGITAATLLYVLAVAGLAYQLKRMPRPYSTARSKRYLRSIERLRVSLWAVFTLLGANALLFLIPAITGLEQHAATIFGGLDLICAMVLYGVWKWAGQLRNSVLANAGKGRE